jgi:hypothetical protein
MWFSKEKPESIVLNTLSLKNRELEIRIDALEQKFTSLRGLVNRRLYGNEEEEIIEKKESAKEKDLSNLIPKFL